MKKWTVITLVILSFVFLNAAPWEGAATVAPAGELPDTGFYVATNSFPKNSLVDITNIETGKTTRAIVSNTLNSPGLLATVSREAADLIGMRTGSVSRIRMVQPVEPTAYSRFTEDIASGNPYYDYDSGSVITEETHSAPAASVPSSSTPAAGTPSTGTSAGTPAPSSAPAASPESAAPALSDLTGPSYTLEPEWRTRESIVNVPITEHPSVKYHPDEGDEIAETKADAPYETEEEIFEAIVEATYEEDYDYYEYDYYEEIAEYPDETFYEEEFAEEIAKAPAETTTNREIIDEIARAKEEIIDEIGKAKDEIIDELAKIEESSKAEDKVAEAPKEDEQPPSEVNQFVIVPAEERPPEGLYGINPDDIIPGIRIPEKETPVVISDSDIIQSITPQTPAVSENIFEAAQRITLDRGKYYVQLAAYDSEEPVLNALKEIDNHYIPFVYKDGDTWYRILLGPLNQGESAAILQRFKSIGYKDAFVRYVR